MNDAPRDDLERLDQLRALAKTGKLTAEEEDCLRRIYTAHGPWGPLDTSIVHLLEHVSGATLSENQKQVFGWQERQQVDAILASHRSPDDSG